MKMNNQKMTTAYIALGSNLSKPVNQLNLAIYHLKQLDTLSVISISPYYLSKPVDKSIQPDFVNAVIKITTSLSAIDLLSECKRIEALQGRKKSVRWGPRVIDLDILLYNRISQHNTQLTLPHPEMLNRDFVLKPLLDIWPEATLPNGTLLKPYLERLEVNLIKLS